ncbi:hypothetical protein C0993_004913 [Termitomyces sp. T159_Od127]|nr:hypothetical protein C0993_004913 [Termitomyces sp. T159_Od127]
MFSNSRDPQGLDWEYFQLNPQCTFHFVDQGDGSSLVMVLVGILFSYLKFSLKGHELHKQATEGHSPPIINTRISGKDACDTGDLLGPHPTRPDYWKVVGKFLDAFSP